MTPRPALDLSLYLVTDTELCGGRRGVLDTVAAAVAGGVTAVQLRDPKTSTRELAALGRSLQEALAGTGVPLIVNDRADVAVAIEAAGVHVGQHDLPPEAARAMVGDGPYVGLSVQTVQHLDAVRALPPGTVDYLGVGPVFPQRTKADAAAPGGLDVLTEIVGTADVPCVAIGGITVDNAIAARATGVHGIAVVSAICGHDDPAGAARALRQHLQDQEVG